DESPPLLCCDSPDGQSGLCPQARHERCCEGVWPAPEPHRPGVGGLYKFHWPETLVVIQYSDATSRPRLDCQTVNLARECCSNNTRAADGQPLRSQPELQVSLLNASLLQSL